MVDEASLEKALQVDDKDVESYLKYVSPKARKDVIDTHYDAAVKTLNPFMDNLAKLEKKKKEADEKWNFSKLDDKELLDVVGDYLFQYVKTLRNTDDKKLGDKIVANYKANWDKLAIPERIEMLRRLWRNHLGGDFIERAVGKEGDLVNILLSAVKQGETLKGVQRLIDSSSKEYFGEKGYLYESELASRYGKAFDNKDPGVISKYLLDSGNKHFSEVMAPYELNAKEAHKFHHLFDLHPEEGHKFIRHLAHHKHKLVGTMAEEMLKSYGLQLKTTEYTPSEPAK